MVRKEAIGDDELSVCRQLCAKVRHVEMCMEFVRASMTFPSGRKDLQPAKHVLQVGEGMGHTERSVCATTHQDLLKEVPTRSGPLDALWEDHSMRDENDLLRCNAICGNQAVQAKPTLRRHSAPLVLSSKGADSYLLHH